MICFVKLLRYVVIVRICNDDNDEEEDEDEDEDGELLMMNDC